MSTISWDESEQLRQARAEYLENAGYTTLAQAQTFAAAIRKLLIFPEQATLPGGNESYRMNHAELRRLLEKAESDVSKLRQIAASSVSYIAPCIRD